MVFVGEHAYLVLRESDRSGSLASVFWESGLETERYEKRSRRYEGPVAQLVRAHA